MRGESNHHVTIALLRAAFEALLLDDYTEDCSIYLVTLTGRRRLRGVCCVAAAPEDARVDVATTQEHSQPNRLVRDKLHAAGNPVRLDHECTYSISVRPVYSPFDRV